MRAGATSCVGTGSGSAAEVSKVWSDPTCSGCSGFTAGHQCVSNSCPAAPQPRAAARPGELRPRCEASRNTWFFSFFFSLSLSPSLYLLQFLGFCGNIFCFIVQGKRPPALCCLLTDELHETLVIAASCRAAGWTSCTTFGLFCLHRWVRCFMPGWKTPNRHLHDF